MSVTLVDVEGVRVDNVAIDYFNPKISFWDGEKWLEQELSRDDVQTLLSALSFISIWHGNPDAKSAFPGLSMVLDELGDE
jgi:hypothetical protein